MAVSSAIFFPSLVKVKKVFGLPVINFLFLRVRRGRSSFRESGHSGFLEKQNVSGNKLKLSLTNLSNVHFSPLLTIEYIPKRINSLIPRFLYNSLSKDFFIKFSSFLHKKTAFSSRFHLLDFGRLLKSIFPLASRLLADILFCIFLESSSFNLTHFWFFINFGGK